jgi:exopolysaccharide biosynthesis protein
VVLGTTQGAYLSENVLHRLTFNRHPRTAIGITRDRVAVLVTVAGRFPGIAAGMTLHEMAQLMTLIGCRDALELDGGGSTTMWIGQAPFNGVVNYPTDNGLFDHEGVRSLRLAVLVMER